MIRVEHLTKEFTRPKRQTGRLGGLRTLVTQDVERATAVDDVSFRVRPARFLVDNVLLTFGSYPLSVFGAIAQRVFTWVVPVAFTAWGPAAVILDRTEGLGVSPAMAWLAPAVGALFFGLGYLVWRRQLRSYASTGS